MPQKIASFFKTSWFPALTLAWLVMQSSWEKVFAFRGHDESIQQLEKATATLPAIQEAVEDNAADIRTSKDEMAQMKHAYFKMLQEMSLMQRKFDRITWAVEAIADKQGIKIPKPVE